MDDAGHFSCHAGEVKRPQGSAAGVAIAATARGIYLVIN